MKINLSDRQLTVVLALMNIGFIIPFIPALFGNQPFRIEIFEQIRVFNIQLFIITMLPMVFMWLGLIYIRRLLGKED